MNSVKFICVVALLSSIVQSSGQNNNVPDTVSVNSAKLKLKGLLWHPAGTGKFPTILFCHGGYETNDTTYKVVENISSIGSVFVRHGYIFLGLFRRGTGLSQGQGKNGADMMAEALKEKGQEGRNKIQLEQLETDQLNDMVAGLNFLRKQRDVDVKHIAIVGHSFGGSLALLVAEHEAGLNAVVAFSPAGFSWDRSPELRKRLFMAVKKIKMPVMIVQAQNDYSLNPGIGLDSTLNKLHKPHVFKIYPNFGNTNREGHNLVFLGTGIWETDVFKFLDEKMHY